MTSMTEFLRVEAFHTFAYEHMVFDFVTGIHSITGKNGEGKSSVFMTLAQGLYNKNPKGGKIGDVNNVITGEQSVIVVEFRRMGDVYKVVNSRKTGTIEVFKNGGERSIAPKGISPSLKLVEDLLGVNYETFVELVYRDSSSTLALVEENGDAARKAFVGKLLNFSELDGLHDKAKQVSRDAEKAIGFLLTRKRDLEASRTQVKEVDPAVDTTAMGREIAHTNEILQATQALCAEQGVVVQQAKVLAEKAAAATKARERALAIEAGLGRFTSPFQSAEVAEAQVVELTRKQAELEAETRLADQSARTRQRIDEVQRELLNTITLCHPTHEAAKESAEVNAKRKAELELDLSRAGNELRGMLHAEPQSVCPTCHQALDVGQALEVYRQRKAFLEKEISQLEPERQEVAKALDAALADLATFQRIADLRKELDQLKQQPLSERSPQDLTDELRGVVERLKLAGDEAKKHRRKEELEQELKVIQASNLPTISEAEAALQLDQASAQLQKYQENAKALQNALIVINSDLTKAQEHNTIRSTVEKFNQEVMIHNAGIDVALAECAEELARAERSKRLADRWVGVLGRNGYRLHRMQRFLTMLNDTMQRYAVMVADGRIACRFYLEDDGKIAFTVKDAYKAVPYSQWSAGEKARVNLTCMFAVLEIMGATTGIGFNLLFLDEVFASLDEEGRNGLFRVLNALRSQGKCIYTIAHSAIANAVEFDSTIRAYKHNGLACIERGGDHVAEGRAGNTVEGEARAA